MEELVALANDVGLYAEEIDTRAVSSSGTFRRGCPTWR